jgi:hypothetical protein
MGTFSYTKVALCPLRSTLTNALLRCEWRDDQLLLQVLWSDAEPLILAPCEKEWTNDSRQ